MDIYNIGDVDAQSLVDTIKYTRVFNRKNDYPTHPVHLSPAQYKAPSVPVLCVGNTKTTSKTATKK